jgi:predicted heme/steroid binding protein
MESNQDGPKLPEISRGNLALHNGTDKPEIWIAYKGIVYDVTVSRLWKNGKHYEHWAGQDLTKELADAPHAEWVFDKFDPVAILKP